MARSRFCKSCQGWHDLNEAWPAECSSHFGIKNDAPYVRTDGIDPIRSMADGQMYDSKSNYYRSVKRAGCEIVGDDRAGFGKRPEYRPQGVGESIKTAIEKLGAR